MIAHSEYKREAYWAGMWYIRRTIARIRSALACVGSETRKRGRRRVVRWLLTISLRPRVASCARGVLIAL